MEKDYKGNVEGKKAAGDKKPKPPAKSTGFLAPLGLDDAAYFITISKEKFKFDSFEKAFNANESVSSAEGGWTSVLPQRAERVDYHVDFSWWVVRGELRFRAQYTTDNKPKGTISKDLYAETFMQWLGDFFKYESAEVHCHVHLKFPLESKQSNFPLPLKLQLAGGAEIDGIALKLPAKPQGVSRVRLSQGKKFWYVEIISDRKMVFKEFDPFNDVSSYGSVLDSLMEAKT